MANDFTGDANCVALWSLDNGALTTDSKGSNTLTDNNTVGTDTINYKEGDASADFEAGNGESLSITDANLDSGFPFKSGESNNKVSAVFWVRWESVSAFQQMIGKWDTGAGERSWMIRNNSGQLEFYIGHSGGTSFELLDNTYTSYVKDVWYHIGLTLDGATKAWKLRVWDDTAGSVVHNASGTASNSPSIDSGDFALGASYNSGSTERYFDGLLDEVAVFKDILSVGDIDDIRQGIYTSGAISATATDGFDMSDSAQGQSLISRTATDGVDMSDTSTVSRVFSAVAVDGVDLGEAIAKVVDAVASANDGIILSDVSAGKATFQLTGTDGVDLSDLSLTPINWHDASSMDITVGSIVAGDLAYTHIENEVYLQLAETVGSPGFDYVFNFGEDTPVPSAKGTLYFDGFYDGNPAHIVKVMQWNYNTTLWVNVTNDAQDIPSTATKQAYEFTLIDDPNYISNGEIKLRIFHNSAGNINHYLFIDRLHLVPYVTYEATAEDGFTLGEIVYTPGDSSAVFVFYKKAPKRFFRK